MRNHELITVDEEMMKAASDAFFRQFIVWANSSDVNGEGWIPVSAALPNEDINPVTQDAYVYPVTVDFGNVRDVRYFSFCRGHWYSLGPHPLDDIVIAWMPRPEPYRPEALREAGDEAGKDAAE